MFATPRPIALIAPRLDTGPAAQAVQACAGILAGAGYYLAAGPWHEPASGPGLHALAPAAALCLGPVDPSGLRAALTALEIPVVETWAAPASPLDSAVLLANAESAARPPATSPTALRARRLRQRRHAVGTRAPPGFPRRRADAGPGTGGRHRAARGLAAERRPDGLPAAAGHQYPVRRRVRQFGPAGRRLCPRPTTAICMCRRMSRCWDCQRTAARAMGAGPEHLTASAAELGRRAGLLLLERLAGDRGPGARIMLEAVLEARLST